MTSHKIEKITKTKAYKGLERKDKKMEEEERIEITRAIEETKTVQKQEEVISMSITTAFEQGRISEGEYYYLLVQYQIISKLEAIETSIGVLSLK
ncbi:hypothetical protein ES703_14271 [subsurface metagenome]